MIEDAVIRFSKGNEGFYIYAPKEGNPEKILIDIGETLRIFKSAIDGKGVNQLVSYFLGINFNHKHEIQDYEIRDKVQVGDEAYRYFVKWDEKKKEYDFGLVDENIKMKKLKKWATMERERAYNNMGSTAAENYFKNATNDEIYNLGKFRVFEELLDRFE